MDGVRIAFAETGTGPSLVRVANWFTHLDLDWCSTVWRHWFDALSHRRTLIRYDARGSGLSDRRVDDFSLERWVDDLEAVVDAAGLTRFPLIGLCQGGVVAAAYAARHPHRVSRLILYGSYPFGAYVEDTSERLAQEARAVSQMIEIGWGKETGAFRELFANLLMPDADKQALQWIGEMQRRSASARNARQMWDAFHWFDLREIATNIETPTLIFHGRKDAMVPFEAGRHLASLIPDAHFVPLETRNHILLPGEDAWEDFRRELTSFLEPEADVSRYTTTMLDDLTARETEILNAIAHGLSNREVAELLKISEKTVRNHLTMVFCKLGMTSRAQAIIAARDAGLGRD